MRLKLFSVVLIGMILSCSNSNDIESGVDNYIIELKIPKGFPVVNSQVLNNVPTKYGVLLGEKLFHDKRLSRDQTISCNSCHHKEFAYADNEAISEGVMNRKGFRNAPSIANMAFFKAYTWDGSKLDLEKQALVPIISKEEMDFSILEIIERIGEDPLYKDLYYRAFLQKKITGQGILKAIAQYEYTLVSAKSKYDRVVYDREISFSLSEQRGYYAFQQKCSICHSGALFTDQSYRNIGLPINPDRAEEGRARVSGDIEDLYKFRVPSLRNVLHTAPYGSFGQFTTLRDFLNYISTAVIDAPNLDPFFKSQANKIPLSKQEIDDLIDFMSTLSDKEFLGH